MDSPVSSSIAFRGRDETQLDAPLEWEPYRLELNVPSDHWHEMQLTVQGESQNLYLIQQSGREIVCADWPRSSAGYYQVKVTWPGGEHTQVITIWPAKLSRASFNQLLDDLEQSLPVAVAIALQRVGALSGIELPRVDENTIASEVVRLRRALYGTESRAGLLHVLRRIAADPHQVLDSTEIWAPRWRARRPHPTALRQAISQPHNRASDRLPNHILDRHVLHSVDVYENRVMKLFVRQVTSRLRRVQSTLQRRENSGLEHEVGGMLFQLRTVVNAARFLDEVSNLTLSPTRVSMVTLKRPEYRAMLQGFLEFRRSPFIRFEHPGLSAPLSNLPNLYQVWGVLIVLKLLAETGQSLGFSVRDQQLVRRDSTGVYIEVLPRSRPALVLTHPERGLIVRAWPERSFGRGSVLINSVSYSQRPDLVVEVANSAGGRRLIVFDPKYKLRGEVIQEPDDELPISERDLRPLKADVDKMHTYRDAIRDTNNQRVVEFAATLYPGTSKWFGRDIAALGAIPGVTLSLEAELREVLMRELQREA